MIKLSPMQIVRQLTGKQKPVEAKVALAKSLAARLKDAQAEKIQTLSNSEILRLCRRHAPDLLGAFAPKAPKAKA